MNPISKQTLARIPELQWRAIFFLIQHMPKNNYKNSSSLKNNIQSGTGLRFTVNKNVSININF